MAKYMLIMRNSGSETNFEDMDFEAVINAMGAYNESMMKAGVLLGGEGLTDAAQGAVVEFTAEAPIVSDGPYGEVHELFNGFWTLEVATREEAIEWASRAPLGPGNKIEVRRMTDESDFADYSDNEYIQKEEGWREELAKKSQA
ncbi:YciI family protein [Salinibacterium sp. SYSU T00001]|uniref:YciI family protein n=1 Tax=Homoserinimonas sedimenticola TaxID=2986805 RepID=UPI002235FFDD|nr:YciI family protein [Salinibacterium sedimenticola]MCW4385658.1 YciI family protein [Salinibacterium sedimenticola]